MKLFFVSVFEGSRLIGMLIGRILLRKGNSARKKTLLTYAIVLAIALMTGVYFTVLELVYPDN